MKLVTWIAMAAALTVVAVSGLNPFQVYSSAKVVAAQVDRQADDSVGNSSAAGREADLVVEFVPDEYANLFLMGTRDEPVIVENITFNWDYRSCGGSQGWMSQRDVDFQKWAGDRVLLRRRYDSIPVTKDRGSKLLDRRPFYFNVDTNAEAYRAYVSYPETGIYTVWISFDKRPFDLNEGELANTRFETQHIELVRCP